MSLRDALTAVLLGAVGIVAAVAIAVFANRITGEEIGLASSDLLANGGWRKCRHYLGSP